MFCPGSVAETKDLPDTTNDAAEEGTFAHYVSELKRNGKSWKELKGFTSEDGKWSVDQEMIDSLDDFHDYCFQFDTDENFVELRVHYDEYVDDGFGTSDHIGIDTKNAHVVVGDLKYGKRQVNAKGNIQLKLYALGVYCDWSSIYKMDRFTLFIGQPRINHRDQWEITTERLLDWAENHVKPAGKRVHEAIELKETTGTVPKEYFRAGAWCDWCLIRQLCKTRAEMVRNQVLIGVDDLDTDEDTVTSESNLLTDEELGVAHSKLEQIRSWCNDIEAAVGRAVKQGKKIISGYDDDDKPEYFKYVEGRSNRVWRDDDEAEAALIKAGVDEEKLYTWKFVGPAPMEKELGKKHKIFTETNLVVKPQGKPVLVPGSDRRPEYQAAASEMEILD